MEGAAKFPVMEKLERHSGELPAESELKEMSTSRNEIDKGEGGGREGV